MYKPLHTGSWTTPIGPASCKDSMTPELPSMVVSNADRAPEERQGSKRRRVRSREESVGVIRRMGEYRESAVTSVCPVEPLLVLE